VFADADVEARSGDRPQGIQEVKEVEELKEVKDLKFAGNTRHCRPNKGIGVGRRPDLPTIRDHNPVEEDSFPRASCFPDFLTFGKNPLDLILHPLFA
jgi:hypothetical protein